MTIESVCEGDGVSVTVVDVCDGVTVLSVSFRSQEASKGSAMCSDKEPLLLVLQKEGH